VIILVVGRFSHAVKQCLTCVVNYVESSEFLSPRINEKKIKSAKSLSINWLRSMKGKQLPYNKLHQHKPMQSLQCALGPLRSCLNG